MAELLQILHCGAGFTCDSRVQLSEIIKTKEPDWKSEDKFHGDGVCKKSLQLERTNSTMGTLMKAATDVIDLGQVYAKVRVDNPMGAYTIDINWSAADWPGITHGERLCTSHIECPDVIEKDVEDS